MVIFLIAVAAVSIGSLAAAVGCSRLQQAAACSDGVDAEEPRAHRQRRRRRRRSRAAVAKCEDQEAAAGPAAAVPVWQGRCGDGAVWCAVALPPKARVSAFTVHLQSSIAYGFIHGLYCVNGECVTEPRAPLGLVPPLYALK